MPAPRARWITSGCALGAALLGTWLSLGLAEDPAFPPVTRALPARPLTPAPVAPRMSPAQRMQPLTPLLPIPPATDATSEQTTGCIVLGNGKVFQGVITQLPEAYQVRSKVGVVVLPFSQVRTVASSLEQAYQQLRESYEQPSTGDHIDLGRWCEQNQLWEAASTEAQAALVLEPTRKEALALLKRAETAWGRAATPPIDQTETVLPGPPQTGAVISAQSQLEFSRHIQRLALNKCGNGGCHGASALSSFKLTKGTRSGQNLQSILSYIDTENPADSPLLVKARSVDGPHAGLFSGSLGSDQYARLSAWVEKVVAEQNNPAGIRRRPSEPRSGGPVLTIRPRQKESGNAITPTSSPTAPAMSLDNAPEIELTPPITTASAQEPARAPRAPRPLREAPLKSAAIQKLLDSQEPDAFDPEEFNRLIHGDRASGKE